MTQVLGGLFFACLFARSHAAAQPGSAVSLISLRRLPSAAEVAECKIEGDCGLSLTVQAPAAPAEGQRPGMTMRQRSQAALSGLESSGLVTLTESAEDAAGGDDAEMEEEVVGEPASFIMAAFMKVIRMDPAP